MNREIKFRVWTGTKMEYNVMAGFLGAFYVQGMDEKDKACMSNFNTVYPEQTPVMQHIGLKDKNGVDIYEGDFVEWENGDYGNVHWNDEVAAFLIANGRIKWGEPPDLIPWSTCKVVGNIYDAE